MLSIRAWLLVLVIAVCVLAVPQQAAAQTTLDPSDLHILACSGCPGGGDPNIINSGGTIVNAGGQNLSGDLLLILAAPNLADGWAGAGTVGPAPWELDTDHDGGWAYAAGDVGGDGIFSTGDNVYDYLGLSGDNSNNFTNFVAADYAYAGSPYNATTNAITQYGLSVFEYPNATLSKSFGSVIDFTLGSNVPSGTILAAYIWSSGTHANPFVSPFTEAGLDSPGSNPVPEPGTLLFLGTGLLSFAGFVKKRLA